MTENNIKMNSMKKQSVEVRDKLDEQSIDINNNVKKSEIKLS